MVTMVSLLQKLYKDQDHGVCCHGNTVEVGVCLNRWVALEDLLEWNLDHKPIGVRWLVIFSVVP